MDTRFTVITTCYNCEKWIKNCIESVGNQEYKNWDMIIIDDGSTDLTKQIIDDYIITQPQIKCIHNEKNNGRALENIIFAIKTSNADDENIIISLDGDDWLSNNYVMTYLDNIYKDSQILITYGQFEPLSHEYHNYCKPIIDIKTYRKTGFWVTSHLRSFKKKLFNKIKDEDLKDENGKYYKTAWDLAFMFPMLEMAGEKRSKFIPDVLYIYNDKNELNDMKKRPQEQLSTEQKLRNKPSYEELP